jgi:hypothetical protein
MTREPAKPTPGPRALATRVSELKTLPIEWLWPGRIAQAKLTLIGGPAGSRKIGAGDAAHRRCHDRRHLAVPGR